MPLEPCRAAAAQRLAAMGPAQKSDEYWRYSDPALFAGEGGATGAGEGVFAATPALKITFTDGVFDPALSDDLAMAGVEITLLPQVQGGYGVLEAKGQSPVPRPFAAQNTSRAEAGIGLRVTEKLSRPISIVYNVKSNTSAPILHHYMKIEAGAEATILESGSLAAGANTVLEIDIADGAALHHIRAQEPDAARRSLAHIFARLGQGARLKSFTLTAQGAATRNESVIWLEGDDAAAHIAGAALGNAARAPMHQDDTVFITHDGLRGESRQVFKKVLSNGAVGVFQGKILVKPGAQKTDGYQISQALLLDDAAQFLAKPELEIYADDVKCSHGSTTGAIDETALFYLRARGVPRSEAVQLLVLSFLADALDEIEDEALRDIIGQRLAAWLAEGP